MANYLTLPAGLQQPNSAYSPSISALQQLYANLSGVNAVINQAGEGMSQEYPTPLDVASFVMDGGIYIDWAGWPMYYTNNNGNWNAFDGSDNFSVFLNSAGVSAQYIDSFVPSDLVLNGCITFSAVPYPRMWMSEYLFPASGSVIISPGEIFTCASDIAKVYGYDMVAVQAGSGWYFYASNSIDPLTYANFIRQTLGYGSLGGQQAGGATPPATGSVSGSGGLCPTGSCLPAGAFAPGGCVLLGPEGPGCGSGSGTGSSQGGATTSTVNWWLIGGIAAAALGVIGVIMAVASE